jgi:hypothetical protein
VASRISTRASEVKIISPQDNLILAIEDMLETICLSSDLRDALLELRERQADMALDAMQLVCNDSSMEMPAKCFQWLDVCPSSNHPRPNEVIALLLKLSARSGGLPTNMYLDGVAFDPKLDATEFGGFADVFRGMYGGRAIAIKRLRISEEDRDAVHPVSCSTSFRPQPVYSQPVRHSAEKYLSGVS